MHRLSIIADEIRKLADGTGMPEEGELNYWAWEIDFQVAGIEGKEFPAKPRCPVCSGAFVTPEVADEMHCSECGMLLRCPQCQTWFAERKTGVEDCCSQTCKDQKDAEWEAVARNWPPPKPTDMGLARMIHDLFAPGVSPK